MAGSGKGEGKRDVIKRIQTRRVWGPKVDVPNNCHALR